VDDPHFIGWLPMPKVFARFLLPVAIGATVGLAAVAAVVAWGQPSPGDGKWEEKTTTLVGVVYTDPYPMIRVPGDDPTAPPRTMLLVGEGKVGVNVRVAALHGLAVQVQGTRLERAGWRMLEVADAPDALTPADLSEAEQFRLRRSTPHPRGRVKLRGEIVDAKCYLGAMKPGEGRTHRGCALLCLKGGIPPLFISRSEETGPAIYLVASESGGAATDSLLDLAGLPVEVEGAIEEYGDLSVIRVGQASHTVDFRCGGGKPGTILSPAAGTCRLRSARRSVPLRR
jgi:hypothetical protein